MGTKAEKFAELKRKDGLFKNYDEIHEGLTQELYELENEEIVH